MNSLKEQGFTIYGTGGNCSAWVKQLSTGQYVVLTDAGGLSHKFETDMLVGIYDGSDEETWGELISSFEIDLTKEQEYAISTI